MSALLDLDGKDLVGPFRRQLEGGVQVARGHPEDLLVPVQHDLDGEDGLVPDDLQRVHHVLVDRVAFQRQHPGLGPHGHAMVLLDRLVRCDARKERFPSAGVAGEVVRFHAGDDDQSVRLHGDVVDPHLRAVLRSAQQDHLVLARIVGVDHAPGPGADARRRCWRAPPRSERDELRWR